MDQAREKNMVLRRGLNAEGDIEAGGPLVVDQLAQVAFAYANGFGEVPVFDPVALEVCAKALHAVNFAYSELPCK